MELKAKTAFSWAHRGVEVKHYEAGQVIDTDDQDLIDVATAEGWVEKASKPAESKARKSAPENK